jgi:hypothetical protein
VSKKIESYSIEKDTPIQPWAVAESVVGEVNKYLHQRSMGEEASRILHDEDRLVSYLTAFAQGLYQRNEDVRRKIRRKGNGGRDFLYTFMRHWLSAELARSHPKVFKILPNEFKVGHPLPKEVEGAKVQARP